MKTILLGLLVLFAIKTYAQFERVRFFQVEVDTLLEREAVFFNDEDSLRCGYLSDLTSYYDSCGVIPFEQALFNLSPNSCIDNVVLRLNLVENSAQWIVDYNKKTTHPLRFGGYGGFIKYHQKICDAKTGKLLFSKRIKDRWFYTFI